MQKHKLEISRMPGLTRLKCEPCKFYAALIDGATEAETKRLVREAADGHAEKPKQPKPVKYEPMPEGLEPVFTGGFSELRGSLKCGLVETMPCVCGHENVYHNCNLADDGSPCTITDCGCPEFVPVTNAPLEASKQ